MKVGHALEQSDLYYQRPLPLIELSMKSIIERVH